jgi:hypothetical protein
MFYVQRIWTSVDPLRELPGDIACGVLACPDTIGGRSVGYAHDDGVTSSGHLGDFVVALGQQVRGTKLREVWGRRTVAGLAPSYILERSGIFRLYTY